VGGNGGAGSGGLGGGGGGLGGPPLVAPPALVVPFLAPAAEVSVHFSFGLFELPVCHVNAAHFELATHSAQHAA
tara:strand:- start:578 stop:799 length:222 start_codon:yes stop_codon:yes gene_type:complete